MLKYFLLASLILANLISPITAGFFHFKCPLNHLSSKHQKFWDLCLYNSVIENDPVKVLEALRHHAHIDLKDDYNNNLLHVALHKGANISIVKYLLHAGADINAINTMNQTPLCALLESKKYDIEDHKCLVMFLLNYHLNVNETYADNNTPLHTALCEGCDKAIIQSLLTNKANPNALNSVHETPLHILAQSIYYKDKQQIEIAQDLLDHGAAPSLEILDTGSPMKHTPLYEALWSRKYPLASFFLHNNSPVDSIEGAHTSSLYLLLWTLRVHADQSLFASGSSPDMTSEDIYMAKFLLSKGAHLDGLYGSYRETILNEVIKTKSAPCLKLFIQAGILDTLSTLGSHEKEFIFMDIMKILSHNIYNNDSESLSCVKLLVQAGLMSYLPEEQKKSIKQFLLNAPNDKDRTNRLRRETGFHKESRPYGSSIC